MENEIKYKFLVYIKGTGKCIGEGPTMEIANHIVETEEYYKRLKGDFEYGNYEIVRRTVLV